mgnify:CR=1 FL=1
MYQNKKEIIFRINAILFILAVLVLTPLSFCQAQIQQHTYRSTVGWSQQGFHFDFVTQIQGWDIALAPITEASLPPALLSIIPQPLPKSTQLYQYNAADLAFFCRVEVKLERATKIPVRFRLGDVQYVDYLENKFDGWRYGY